MAEDLNNLNLPAAGRGLLLDLAGVKPSNISAAGVTGTIIDPHGDALIMAVNGGGVMLHLDSSAALDRLITALLILRRFQQQRCASDTAAAELDRIIAERATVAGHGHG